jgi:hypothetical protein
MIDNPGTEDSAQGMNAHALPTILVVEDHDDTALAISKLLQNKGYAVHTASTVAEALRIAGCCDIDIIISDIGLPDGSGHDLMNTVRNSGDVEGIAITGFGSKDGEARSRPAGFSEHLIEPISFGQLEAALDRLRD